MARESSEDEAACSDLDSYASIKVRQIVCGIIVAANSTDAPDDKISVARDSDNPFGGISLDWHVGGVPEDTDCLFVRIRDVSLVVCHIEVGRMNGTVVPRDEGIQLAPIPNNVSRNFKRD